MKVFANRELATDVAVMTAQLSRVYELLETGDELDFDNAEALLRQMREMPLAVKELTDKVNRHLSMGQQGKDSTLFDAKGKPIKPKKETAPKAKKDSANLGGFEPSRQDVKSMPDIKRIKIGKK